MTMGFSDQRKLHLHSLLEYLKNNNEIEVSKAIAKCMFKYGWSKKMLADYLKTLRVADMIEIREGKIYVIDKSD